MASNKAGKIGTLFLLSSMVGIIVADTIGFAIALFITLAYAITSKG